MTIEQPEQRPKPEQKPFHETDPVVEQFERISYLAKSGLYSEISPERFPNIPPFYVAIAKFNATNGAICEVLKTQDKVKDPKLRDNLGILASRLIETRDSTLDTDLGEQTGEIDHERIVLFKKMKSSNALDNVRSYIDLGLVDEINERNFPELGSLHPKSMSFIQLLALQANIDSLDRLRTGARKTGFTGNTDFPVTLEEIDAKIEAVRETYADTLAQYFGKK